MVVYMGCRVYWDNKVCILFGGMIRLEIGLGVLCVLCDFLVIVIIRCGMGI